MKANEPVLRMVAECSLFRAFLERAAPLLNADYELLRAQLQEVLHDLDKLQLLPVEGKTPAPKKTRKTPPGV